MPIYEYRCSTCGYQNDFLQKMSEPPLTDCPECGKSTLAKQVTAAGFQLKGTGWYATDFKNNGTGKSGSRKVENKSSTESGADKAGSSESGSKTTDAAACGAGASPACT